MKPSITNRGFKLYQWKDLYGEKATLQKSSLATQHAIWLGSSGRIETIKPGTRRWQEVPLESIGPHGNTVVHNRMHLSQEQVAELIPLLQHFVDTGELP